MTLASKIRELRKEKNLTQEQLARQSEVSVDTLRRWESGRIIPRADELARLAFALKLTRLNVWLLDFFKVRFASAFCVALLRYARSCKKLP